MLSNEVYTGDQLTQKSYSSGQVPFRRIQNNGQLAQYPFENNHIPIVERSQFEAVQRLMQLKAARYGKNQPGKAYPLTNILRCALCGETLHRRKTDRGIEWVCCEHLQTHEKCGNKSIPQSQIEFALFSL